MSSDLPPDTMTDLQEILTTVRDIYQNVSQVHGLIKDHEQDLVIVEKAGSLLEDTKTNLQYLNDCIQNRASGSPHASPHGTDSRTATQPFAKLGEDEMKRQVENTMRHMMTEMFGLLEMKNSSCSADSGVGSAQNTKHTSSVDHSADFDIL